MKLRVGAVNFLNAYPLWANLENDSSIELLLDTPANLAQALKADKLDIALISSVELCREGDTYEYIPDLGIIADEKSYSIRLFLHDTQSPFATFVHTLRKIFTDNASRSSVAQLQIILAHLRWQGGLTETSDNAATLKNLAPDEGLLAIGDFALQNRVHASFDLQSIYFDLFHQPMVYALWCYRKINPPPDLSRFMLAYRAFMTHRKDEISQAAQRFGFSTDFCAEYLNGIIRYELDAAALTGLEFFKSNVVYDQP